MVHKPEPERKLSIKARLAIIAIMFVVINLVFYFGFDSSDESEEISDIEGENQIEVNEDGKTACHKWQIW